MTLTSWPGKGTRVEIWLPLEDGQTERVATLDMVPETRAGYGSLRVLAVDDDALVLMNTAAMLEDLGHVVTEAFSGEAALKLMREGHEFDLVITDHAMPKMTGMDLARALRTEWPRLPIVMATGYAELPEGNVLNLPKLSKPFDQSQLEQAVATAVSTRRHT